MNYIELYLQEIQKGHCIVSKRVRRVYERLVNDMHNPNCGYIFDQRKAERPIEFIEMFCKHSKGEWAGKPVKLELFQKAFISALFGFVCESTGYRRYRETLFYVARKNGKSTMLSGIALYCLIADDEPGAEVYSVASKKDQARIIFDETLNMVKQSPDLVKVVKKRKSDLYFGLTFSKMQPLGKNSDTLDGLNSHLVIMDELHSIKDRNLYEVMKKTTKRIEDWQNDAPEYYALQAALYAYLLGVDNVVMVASFLEEKDYADPSKYVPNVKNTITVEFKVSERYPDFAEKVAQVEQWWADYVDTGISPVFDEKKDAEILKALRTHNLTPDTDIDALIAEAEGLKTEVDKATAAIADKEKRLKEINDIIKEHAMKQFRPGDKKVEVKGATYTWAISRSETTTIDKKALEADGLLDKYQKKTEQFRMTVK